MYKYAVVGNGLIGSAAARHLTDMTDGVVVIGPDEPAERTSHNGVFASHYDEGRMTRIVDPIPEWSMTAKRSIARYRELEQRSGISFYTPAGYLGLGGPELHYNDRCAAVGISQGATLERLDAAQIRQRYPFLNVADDADGLTEYGSAGYISPRSMVKAQSMLAENGGATLVKDAAVSISPISNGLEIGTLSGASIKAEKAIVATGAFTQAWGLVPKNLNLNVYGRTVVLAEIKENELADFANMPTMIHCESDAYILPPIRYPDGRYYLKLGNGSDADERLQSRDALDRWFKGSGSETDRRDFTDLMKSIFPALNACDNWHVDTCATTYTMSGLPIIDYVNNDRVLITIGGCGKGAKGSDEWGYIAASTLLDHAWQHQIDRERLRFS